MASVSKNRRSGSPNRKGELMHVEIDPTRCDSTGRCVMICPEVFRFRTGDKRAAVIQDPVPEVYRAAVLKAAAACPTEAISVRQEE